MGALLGSVQSKRAHGSKADGQAASGLGLVGDIGGTNARFALAEAGPNGVSITGYENLLCRDYPGIQEALADYFGRVGLKSAPDGCVIAVAGPVTRGAISLTNVDWSFSEGDLRSMGFGAARLINDYVALALGAPACSGDGLRHVGGPAQGEPGETVAVAGAGTGFGVSAVGKDDRGQATLATEGGHIAFAPVDDLEIEILKVLRAEYGRVSVERILSGPGLAALHGALAKIHGEAAPDLKPHQIGEAAKAGDPACGRTVEQFFAIFGSVAGDLALALGARGGMYLGGGIAPTLAAQLEASRFRARFEDKGRFHGYLAAIPTWIITSRDCAMIGAGQALAEL
jgi:glucokinase